MDLEWEKEEPWSWKCSYAFKNSDEVKNRFRQKVRISKGYSGFCPVPGLERPQGPVPARRIFSLAALGLTAALEELEGIIGLTMPALERLGE